MIYDLDVFPKQKWKIISLKLQRYNERRHKKQYEHWCNVFLLFKINKKRLKELYRPDSGIFIVNFDKKNNILVTSLFNLNECSTRW